MLLGEPVVLVRLHGGPRSRAKRPLRGKGKVPERQGLHAWVNQASVLHHKMFHWKCVSTVVLVSNA